MSILDGGMAAWEAEQGDESGPGAAPVQATYPVAIDNTWRCDCAAVVRAAAEGSAVLLDTRSAAYFEGPEKSPQALRAGRVPGSLHLDHAGAFDKGALRLKPLGELERMFAGVPAKAVMSYCNTGHQAATSWFILSELLHRPGATLYDGSMSEWTEDPAREVATGPAD